MLNVNNLGKKMKEEFSLGAKDRFYVISIFCLVFVKPLYASVYLCLVVTCWERADLQALICGVLL